MAKKRVMTPDIVRQEKKRESSFRGGFSFYKYENPSSVKEFGINRVFTKKKTKQ